MPGEFEPQQAVWLGLDSFNNTVTKDLVKALLPYVNIKFVSQSDSVLQKGKSYLSKNGIDTGKIQFYVMPDNQFYMRDHGATFIKNADGEIKAVDFSWSSYGYADRLMEKYNNDTIKVDSILTAYRYFKSKRGKVDSLMGIAEKVAIVPSWIKIEGGAIESNGRGTLLLNEPLTLSRNKGVSKDSIEKEFKRVLGIKNIIWLRDGLAEDPDGFATITGKYVGLGAGGHIDEYARFADTNTILLAWIDEADKDKNPVNKINYDRMHVNYEILQKARNENGAQFKIVKVPLPDLIGVKIRMSEPGNSSGFNVPVSIFKPSDGWKIGDSAIYVAASSYLNYYVTNGIVLLPTYVNEGSSPQKEEKVKEIFNEVFPGRKLVFIDAMPMNWEGGGIHCATQPEPK